MKFYDFCRVKVLNWQIFCIISDIWKYNFNNLNTLRYRIVLRARVAAEVLDKSLVHKEGDDSEGDAPVELESPPTIQPCETFFSVNCSKCLQELVVSSGLLNRVEVFS